MDGDDRETLLGNHIDEEFTREAHSSTSLNNNNNSQKTQQQQRDYANDNFHDIDLARRASGNTDDGNYTDEGRGLIASERNEEENGTRIRGARGDTVRVKLKMAAFYRNKSEFKIVGLSGVDVNTRFILTSFL